MNAFYFIFSRFKKLKSKKGFLSFNFYLSVCLITFSFIAIVLTDSLTDGYKKEVFSKLSSLNPDVKILKKNTNFSFKDYSIVKNKLSSDSLIFSPYIEKAGILISNNKISSISNELYKQREGVYIIGVESDFLYNNKIISKYFEYKKSSLDENSVIIGSYLAKKINKSISDEIDLLFFDSYSNSFIAKKFNIQNIYNTQTQNDEFLVYVPISSLASINDNFYCNGFIGYYINGKNNLLEIDDSSILIQSWDSANILKFLNSFDIPIKLLMWVLIFLSVYSLSSLIFNFLINKQNDLKLLSIMGCSIDCLRNIILAISLYITAISVGIGILISSLFIYMQNKFQFISLPSEKIFQLSVLPAHFDILYFVKYPIFLFLFTVFISLYIFNKNFKIDLN